MKIYFSTKRHFHLKSISLFHDCIDCQTDKHGVLQIEETIVRGFPEIEPYSGIVFHRTQNYAFMSFLNVNSQKIILYLLLVVF